MANNDCCPTCRYRYAAIMDEELTRIRIELLEAEIARLHVERRRVLSLVPHWRACALQADSISERETWVLCAEQLEGAYTGGGGIPAGGSASDGNTDSDTGA
jgi:hypothetical protein